jgi:gas vesicle protein
MGQTTEELNTQIADTRESLASDLDALQDKVSPKAVMQRRKSAVSDRWQGMRSKVMGTVGSVNPMSSSGSSESSGPGAVDRVKGGAGDLAGSAEDRVVGSPIAAGLVAFGAGMVIAGLIPATEKESELSQRAVDTVKEHGQPLMETAKSAGQDLAEGLKEQATQAAQEVKETAAESAQRVSDEGKSATQRVASETS